jgi:hypothetical protein
MYGRFQSHSGHSVYKASEVIFTHHHPHSEMVGDWDVQDPMHATISGGSILSIATDLPATSAVNSLN